MQSEPILTLTPSMVQLGGFCTRLNRCDGLVFGNPIRLTVTPKDSSPVDPSLFILSPLQPDGGSEDTLGPEVCLATDFRPKEGEMVLNLRDGPLSLNTSSAVLSRTHNRNYAFAGFTNRSIYSCQMHAAQENNHNRESCTSFHPESARLNFYLLVMNGVRLVFTKALAFSTILTIRAVLF